MAKHYDDVSVGCPFFHYFEGCKIACEGVNENSSIHQAFKSSSERRAYMKRVCYARYKECRVAKALYEKYQEAEERERG